MSASEPSSWQHPSTVGFVFARGGSKGVPGKNLRPLKGVPPIARSIRIALASKYIGAVVVSTDDEEIAEVALREGAFVPALRPEELATDNASEWTAWQHAIEALVPLVPELIGFQTFVSIPTTAPLRQVGDIDNVCDRLWRDDVDIVVTVTASHRSPYFNMVEIVEDQARLAAEGLFVARRQDAPKVFDITTVAYATTPEYVVGSDGIFDGRVGVVEVPQERALDIDTEWDFHIAELVLGRQENTT